MGRHHGEVRRWGLQLAMTCCAAGVVLGLASAAGTAANPSAVRAVVDRPDEVRGSQVHYVYAIPRGGTDRGLDTSGAIAASIDAQQRWFERASGGARFRMDTMAGEPDITYLALPLTAGELSETDIPHRIRDHLRERKLLKSWKRYVVYYEGTEQTSACGRATGPVGVVYLGSDCGGGELGLAAPGAEPADRDFTALHELIHALGYVPDCAPQHNGQNPSHVTGPSPDLMASPRDPSPRELDPGRDDYFGHGRAECPDLARDAFLTTNAPVPTLRITRLRAVLRAGRLAVNASVALHGWQSVSGECRVYAVGVPGYARGTAVSRGGAITCGWRLSPSLARAWKQRRLTFRAQVIARSEGLEARRTTTVRR